MATKKSSSKKGSSKKGSSKAGAKKRGSAKRDLVKGTTDMYAKRDPDGKFKEIDVVKKSVPADRAKKAKTKVKPGYGDQGDQPKRKSSKKSSGK